MTTMVDTDTTTRILNWIKKQAEDSKIAVDAFPGGVVQDGNWFHVPVAVTQQGDAYDRATWLQQIEDQWDPNAFDGVELLLVPARPNEPTKLERYDQVAELMKRKDIMLDKLNKQGDNTSRTDFERIQSIWQELEDKLNELGKLYPGIRNGVV